MTSRKKRPRDPIQLGKMIATRRIVGLSPLREFFR
jgi:hypothetical protein